MISSLSARSCLRFRGVCEAKYTMLTSLQRNCPSIMLGGRADDVLLRVADGERGDGHPSRQDQRFQGDANPADSTQL